MTAGRTHRFGPPDVIVLEEIEVPKPGEGVVLVRKNAAGVGPWDAWIRMGRSALPQSLRLSLLERKILALYLLDLRKPLP
jgi:NADPH:quinone reductase-like Zn-dependent oxidoreductase